MVAQLVSSEGRNLPFRHLMIDCLGSLHGIWDVQLWLSQLQQWWERTQGPLEQEVSVEELQCAKAGSLGSHCCVSERSQKFRELSSVRYNTSKHLCLVPAVQTR